MVEAGLRGRLGSIPALLVIISKSLTLSVPQIPHLKKGFNNSTSPNCEK